jgi:hypothetical protein
MNCHRFVATMAVLTLFLCVPTMVEAKRDLGDYTLRVHIYETSHSHNRWGYHAVGRANLFDEQGVPHGVEFTYDCQDHLMGSSGNEAYPAKWKKPDQSLEVVFGEIGSNPDSFQACEFKVAMKAYVFYSHDHEISTEKPEEFLAKHKSQTPTVGPAIAEDVPVSANPHNP